MEKRRVEKRKKDKGKRIKQGKRKKEKGKRKKGVVLKKIYSLPNQSSRNVILGEQSIRRNNY